MSQFVPRFLNRHKNPSVSRFNCKNTFATFASRPTTFSFFSSSIFVALAPSLGQSTAPVLVKIHRKKLRTMPARGPLIAMLNFLKFATSSRLAESMATIRNSSYGDCLRIHSTGSRNHIKALISVIKCATERAFGELKQCS